METLIETLLKQSMSVKSFNEIKNIIQKYGLKPATQRALPLFTLSCIARGYTFLLREILGFSYEALAAIGGREKFYTMLNEERVAKETGKFVENNNTKIDQLALNKAKRIFKDILSQTKAAAPFADEEPQKCLGKIVPTYIRYMSCIGVYNCFWRYIGNDINKSGLSSEKVKEISNEREVVAKLYPQIEKIIQKCCAAIGEGGRFDGDILRYFTYAELDKYLKSNKSLTKTIIEKLELRRKEYFYLYVEGTKEEVILDAEIIDAIKKLFFTIDGGEIKEIKGFVAFSGKATGKVFNLQNQTADDILKFKEGDILVASMTHPKDIMIIKNPGLLSLMRVEFYVMPRLWQEK